MTEAWERGPYTISTDNNRLNKSTIFKFLSQTYWAKDRDHYVIQKAIDNSLCFGVYKQQNQVGFARVLTDYSITAYIFDVFIIPEYQGLGLGRWLIETILQYPRLSLVTFVLATKDKHEFYGHFGFKRHKNPERIMVLPKEPA